MKKRLISLLLVACTLLTLFPTVALGVSAEGDLPKDESTLGQGAATQEAGLPTMTDYDALYVGADGSSTANGGRLVALFSAVGDDLSSVDLTANTWKDKVGGHVATLRGEGWVKGANGGFGFNVTHAELQTKAANYGISLPETLLTADLAVETLGIMKGFCNADGTLIQSTVHADCFSTNASADASFVRIDLLSGAFFNVINPTNRDQGYGARWTFSYAALSSHWTNGEEVDKDPSSKFLKFLVCDTSYRNAALANGNKPVTMGAYYARTIDTVGNETYTVSYASGEIATKTVTPDIKAKLTANSKTSTKDKAGIFSFFNTAPADVYAIRVYSAPLTDAERAHNSFIDLVAYLGVDLTDYLSLDAPARAMAESVICQYNFSSTGDQVQKAMADLAAVLTPDISLDEVLYVTDGLVALYASYVNYGTGEMDMGGVTGWMNAVNPAQMATIRGSGWEKGANGGYTIVKDLAAYNAEKSFGIYLPVSALPDKSFTLEFVATPDGITTENEDGSRSHYIDEVTPTGTWHEYGIAIGPYRGYQAACYRNPGKDAQMERRWTYSATGGLAAAKWKYRFRDTAWEKFSYGQTTTYAISFAHSSDSNSIYTHYSDQVRLGAMEVTAEEYITNSEAGNMFQLMVGVAGTVYSVRVYDRVLSEDEMARNHVADLLYYYDLDVTVLLEVMEKAKGVEGIFSAFSGIGFNLTKEEAQKQFDACLGTIWMRYSGIGIRKDGKDALRFYFDVNSASIAALSKSGFRIEVGALVNLDKNVLPTWEENYDYKLVGYDSKAGRNAAFYVDKDTFAVTLSYENLEKRAALTNVHVRGYVKLTDANGESIIFYVNSTGNGYTPDNLFKVYDSMKNKEILSGEGNLRQHLCEVTDGCYETVTVYADAAAAAGGSGTKQAPYRSFAESLDAAKALLRKAAAPVKVVVMLADGEYGIYGTATLTGEDMPYPYSAIEITSESGKSVLSTLVDMDASAFTQYADNVWVYQFEKDSDGNYPAFRYLYVDGKMADIAHASGQHAVDEDVHITAFERTYDGVHAAVETLAKTGQLTRASASPYPAHRTDLNEAFERYKEQFLAYLEVTELHKEEALRVNSTPQKGDTALYVTTFQEIKNNRLAIDDLTAQYIASGYNKAGFSKLTPSLSDDASYVQEFTRIRNAMVSDEKIGSFSAYTLYVQPEDMIAIGKYYMAYDLVETFEDELEEGKLLNQKAYDDLLKQYNAADAAGKAALEDDLAVAAERVGSLTWFRYALEHVELEMHMAGQWWYNIVGVAGVDFEDVTYDDSGNAYVACYMRLDEYQYFFVHGTYSMVGRYVSFKNALDYVDEEGESYYDELNGRVYYYTEDGMAGKKVAHPTSDYMLVMNDVRNVSLIGLDFTGVDDYYLSHNDGCLNLGGDENLRGVNGFPTRSAIFIENINGFDMYNCNVYEVGMKGLQVGGQIRNATVEGCEFYRIGANAIYFGNCTRSRSGSEGGAYGIENVVINDNYIHHVALEHHNSTALYMSFGKNTTVSHNTIHDCSYSAIGIGLSFGIPDSDPTERDFYNHYNLDVSYNYIFNYLTEIGDAGAIYVTGGNAPKETLGYFNYMHHNYVVLTNTTGNGRGHMLVGLYFDGSTSNWKCYENVVVEHSYGAVAGEDDDLYAEGDRYVNMLRLRYGGTTPIYVQHIATQITHNILIDNNYVINVRSTDPKKQHEEVYKTYIVKERNILEQNTRYVRGVDAIPAGGLDIIYAAGCYKMLGDAEMLWDNNY
ncbi:MAG: right-handed parallel beta-helix repeat-containing protein [Clostridia bacterium]|nr:right-handed parallel beta-helix repeat-containing protein [Clostridia bacterium]